jgi:hypothetical protein
MGHAADPASLERLFDIVDHPPVSLWWPPAPGWWVLLCIVLAVGTWVLIRWWKSHRANAYRREALRELSLMDDIHLLSQLLKRVALAAYPREKVAALTGEKWLKFLNASAPAAFFEGNTAEMLKILHYAPERVSEHGRNDLVIAAEKWIKTHVKERI